MSLYRTYRPQSFADVVGQDAIVETLEKAAEAGKLAHAFLFAGGRGTGKTSVARILAKVLMVQGIEDEVLQKQIIKGVEEGSLVDLLEIDAASNRGIDDVRDLIEKIQFSPVVSKAKVYIVDEAHMLTKEAFNALLKTLEEPPEYAYFILATTELNKIPVTIQSRCQRFPFRRINEDDIIRRLQYIADQERIDIEREALRAIAHHVQGGMRDAIALLDQLRSLPKITLSDIEDRIGFAGIEHIEAVFAAIKEQDPSAAIAAVSKVEDSGIALDVFLRQLLSIVRESLHTAIENKESTKPLQHMLTTLLDAIRDVRIAPVPGLVVEAALIGLCKNEETVSGSSPKISMKKEEEKAEKKVKKSEAETKETPINDETPSPQQHPMSSRAESRDAGADTNEKEDTSSNPSLEHAEIEAADLSLESLKSHWSDIVNATEPASVKMSLKNGFVVDLVDTTVKVGFSSSFHKDKVANTEASRKIEEVMEKIFKRSLKLECIVGEGETKSSEAVADEDAVDLAAAAAEIF